MFVSSHMYIIQIEKNPRKNKKGPSFTKSKFERAQFGQNLLQQHFFSFLFTFTQCKLIIRNIFYSLFTLLFTLNLTESRNLKPHFQLRENLRICLSGWNSRQQTTRILRNPAKQCYEDKQITLLFYTYTVHFSNSFSLFFISDTLSSYSFSLSPMVI